MRCKAIFCVFPLARLYLIFIAHQFSFDRRLLKIVLQSLNPLHNLFLLKMKQFIFVIIFTIFVAYGDARVITKRQVGQPNFGFGQPGFGFGQPNFGGFNQNQPQGQGIFFPGQFPGQFSQFPQGQQGQGQQGQFPQGQQGQGQQGQFPQGQQGQGQQGQQGQGQQPQGQQQSTTLAPQVLSK